ncbi:sugar ABC transporter permease [Herbiconiux moechotypicola]|uniref:Sugar ABC transporter permease n=1 Tax=Herbiconiux moechotypicola TaxID=637393 RepID=A0ABN3D8L3_9MICO|nr:sugar ABC transporter permease [Herbiconiux moechotypicola]MCS5728211.1 sugar ABC transporter permease [Herbiconiux moechotypicola]
MTTVTARRPGARRGLATPWLMLIPAIVLFVLFFAAPIAYTLVLSFQKSQVNGLGLGSGGRETVFAGFANYVSSLSDPDFIASVVRVGVYGLILVPTMLGLALLFALLLDSKRTRAKGFSRVTIFLPYAVPAVISSLLWGFLYLPAVSPFFDIADALGVMLPDLLSGDAVIIAIANIALWGGVGFNMVVMYTSLKAIPSDIYEAATLDGATEVQIALRIKIPIIMPSLIMTAIFSIIATLQVFAEPVTLKPLSNSISSTFTPLMTVYRDAFTRNDVYAASATSIIIAVATFALSFLFLRVVQRRAFGGEN